MPDVRLCRHCGTANEPEAVRCEICGERFSGMALLHEKTESATTSWWEASATQEARTIPVPPQIREEQAKAQRAAQELERVTREAEQLMAEVNTENVFREQAQRRQEIRTRAEAARRRVEERLKQLEDAEAGVQAAVHRTSPKTAKSKAKTIAQTCPTCGSELGEAGVSFSFCVRCGSDIPVQTVPELEQHTEQEVEQELHQTVRPQGRQTVHQHTVPQVEIHVHQSTVSPTAAAFMSFLMPGVGQLMNGQGAKGVLLLLAMFVGVIIFGMGPTGLMVMIGRILAAIDAYRIAERRRSGKFVRDGEWDLG